MRKLCEHGKRRDLCVACKTLGTGGVGICEHNHSRGRCRECKALGKGGNSLCIHNAQKSQCTKCVGTGVCEHGTRQDKCRKCVGKATCEHGNRRTRCKACKALGTGGSQICMHNRLKGTCRDCGGKAFCIHDNRKEKCSLCNPANVYKDYVRHEKRKNNGILPEQFMSLEEFCNLVKKKCWFCNRTPEQAGGMGVDRIDNSKGHIHGNLETACFICNMMRKSLSVKDFIERCLDIADNQKSRFEKETI